MDHNISSNIRLYDLKKHMCENAIFKLKLKHGSYIYSSIYKALL